MTIYPHMKIIFVFIIYFFFLVYNHSAKALDSNFKNIRQLLEYLQTEDKLPILQEPVYTRDLLMDIYQSIEFKPLWDDRFYAMQCIEALAESYKFGFLPEDYHVPILTSLYNTELADDNPQFDVLLTDGLLLYSHHLLNGKLNPKDFFFSWNFPQRYIYQDSIRDFLKIARKEKVLEDLNEHHPSFAIYWLLVKEREKWIEVEQEAGKLEPILLDKAIKPGDSAKVFGVILKRLKQLKYAHDTIIIINQYDSSFLSTIINFQFSHGLEQDGVIGIKTIEYINMPVKMRIDIIDVNLERLRWLSGGAEDYMVFVNIAGFHLSVVKDKHIIWDTPVMTGTIDTQTPVFTSQLKYLVFNPTWTVPRGILYRSLFNKMKSDPAFITTNNYTLYDSNGFSIDPAKLNWDTITFKNFRFSVIQNPGPNNAMGVVKFMFPNQYAIYLHDTPSKTLFSKSARAFSNGCIRVKDPIILAKILLDDENKYSEQKLKELINSKITKTVFLKESVNILLVYFTVDMDKNGRVVFYEDIYQRDPAILDKLRTPLKAGL